MDPDEIRSRNAIACVTIARGGKQDPLDPVPVPDLRDCARCLFLQANQL